MIVDQAFVKQKKSRIASEQNITIDKENVKLVSNVKRFVIHIDGKSNFTLYIDIICKSAPNQLNVLCM